MRLGFPLEDEQGKLCQPDIDVKRGLSALGWCERSILTILEQNWLACHILRFCNQILFDVIDLIIFFPSYNADMEKKISSKDISPKKTSEKTFNTAY